MTLKFVSPLSLSLSHSLGMEMPNLQQNYGIEGVGVVSPSVPTGHLGNAEPMPNHTACSKHVS